MLPTQMDVKECGYFAGKQRRKAAARTIALLIVGVLWAAVTPTLSLAQVKLPTVNLGETNFEDGFALPGWFLQEFPESYVAGELRDGHGNLVPGTNRLTADSTTTHVVYISNVRVLGGWLGGEVLQPIVDLDVRQAANGFLASSWLGPIACRRAIP